MPKLEDFHLGLWYMIIFMSLTVHTHIYPVRIKYKVFRKVVLKVRTTTRIISLDKIYNGVIYFIPYVNIQYTIYISIYTSVSLLKLKIDRGALLLKVKSQLTVLERVSSIYSDPSTNRL